MQGEDIVPTTLLIHILHWYVSTYLSLFSPKETVLLQCSTFLLFTFYDFLLNSVLNFEQFSCSSRLWLVLLLLFGGFVITLTSFIFTKVSTHIYSTALHRGFSMSTLSSPFPVSLGM